MPAPAANAAFRALLDKRLILVTGKGGVGKTTIASALALKTAKLGLRTLLLGVDTTTQIEHFFNLAPLYDFKQVNPRENLFVMNLNRQAILDEFIRKTLKLRTLWEKVLQSPVYQYFTAVAPGLRELMLLNKISELEAQRQRPKKLPMFDLLIVDAPATGHGVSLFEVPRSISRMFNVGPFVKKAQQIQRFFIDHERTTVLMVTLGEEMPANETVELHERLCNDLQMHITGLVVNNLYPALFPNEDEQARLLPLLERPDAAEHLAQVVPDRDSLSQLLESARFQLSRRSLNEQYVELLRERLALPMLEIEFLPAREDNSELLERIGAFFDL
jgi:anion-transporting  ArsA/GET3 family ATPase